MRKGLYPPSQKPRGLTRVQKRHRRLELRQMTQTLRQEREQKVKIDAVPKEKGRDLSI